MENIKHANQGIIWIPEGEEKERGIKNVLEEIMDENLNKETDIQIQEKTDGSKKDKPKQTIPRHIIIKMAKFTERILKAEKGKQRVPL